MRKPIQAPAHPAIRAAPAADIWPQAARWRWPHTTTTSARTPDAILMPKRAPRPAMMALIPVIMPAPPKTFHPVPVRFCRCGGRDRGCRRAPFHAGVDEQAVERVWVGALDLRYLPGWKPRLSGSLRGGRRRARWPRRSGPLGAGPSAARVDPDDRRCATWRLLFAATRVGGRGHVPVWCPAFRCVVALR